MNVPGWADVTDRALTLAAAAIREEEGLAVAAYPDPMSQLGRALVVRHGASAIIQVGQGKRLIDEDLLKLPGHPWTVGYGQTGPDIGPKTVWSRQHAEARLRETVEKTEADVERIWPGSRALHYKARAALISLVYNRGSDLRDPPRSPGQRREMRELGPAIAARDYERMATLVESMKRLWEGKGMRGLLKRRDSEALLIRQGGRAAAKGDE